MFPAKAFYFFYFGAFAALVPFLVLYYERLGFTGQQIGILSAIFPLMVLVSAPFWGMIADFSKRHKTVLVSLIGLAIVTGLVLNIGKSFPSLVLLFSAFAFFVAPIIPLGDTAVLALLGEKKSDYGRLRVWGAVGWGLSAPLAGIVTENYGITWAFYIYAVLMIICLLSCLQLPFNIATDKQLGDKSGNDEVNVVPSEQSSNELSDNSSKSQLALLEFLTPDWLFFLSAVFICGIGLSVSGSFVYLQLSELQATGLIVGLALTMATLSELPLTFYGRQLLERFSTVQLLFVALIVVAVRLMLYGFAVSPLQVLLIQLLHGFCFSIMWIAGIAYADAHAPEGKSATAQGLFSAVLFGLGSAVGGLLGGYLYDSLGSSQMFITLGIGILIASLVLMAIHFIRRKENDYKVS